MCLARGLSFKIYFTNYRYKYSQLSNTLDLVLTNEEHMIDSLLFQPELANSDHICIRFNIHQVDYDNLWNLFRYVNWEEVMDNVNVLDAYGIIFLRILVSFCSKLFLWPLLLGIETKIFALRARLSLLKTTKKIVYGGNIPDPVLNLILLLIPPLVMLNVAWHAISKKNFERRVYSH